MVRKFNKEMRLFTASMIAACAVLSMTACGNKDKENETAAESSVSSEAEEETVSAEEAASIKSETDKEIASWDVTAPESLGEADVADYSNIKYEKQDIKAVTNEDIEGYIKSNILFRNAESSLEPVAVGDIVIGTFDIDEENSTETIVIGEGTFSADVDNALIGKKTGEEIDVDFTFPDTYYDEAKAGKKASMHVSISDVQKIPEVFTDEMAVEAGYENADKARESIREELKKSDETYKKDLEKENAYMSLFDASEVTINEDAVSWLSKYQIKHDAESLLEGSEGYTFGAILAANNMTLSDLEGMMEEETKDLLKFMVFNNAIAKKEGLEITSEDEKAFLDKYSFSNRDEALSIVPELVLNYYILDMKIKDFIIGEAS